VTYKIKSTDIVFTPIFFTNKKTRSISTYTKPYIKKNIYKSR